MPAQPVAGADRGGPADLARALGPVIGQALGQRGQVGPVDAGLARRRRAPPGPGPASIQRRSVSLLTPRSSAASATR